jgi:16S rRNA processing protein RimM
MEKKDKILAAKILKPHGIKGALKVRVFCENWPNLFKKVVNSEGKLMNILHSNLLNKVRQEYVVQISGVEDLSTTIPYIHQELFLPLDMLPTTSQENIFYHHQLIGAEVWDEENNKIGIVQEIYDLKAGDIIVLKLNMGRIVELPFEDSIFPQVILDKDPHLTISSIGTKLLF